MFGHNQFVAFKEFQSLLVRVYGVAFERLEFNKGRHLLLKPVSGDFPSFYLVFKREFFDSFSRQFDRFSAENPEASKVGESINESSLELLIKHKAEYLVFIHPNNAYVAIPHQFYNYAKYHNLVRIQEKPNVYKSNNYNGGFNSKKEITISTPLNELQNIFDIPAFNKYKLENPAKEHDSADGDQSSLIGFQKNI